MTTPGPPNTSGTARLMLGPLGFQVGWQEPVYKASPAAGAQWKHTVDGRYLERLVAVTYTLTTSAAAGQRFAVLNLVDANGTVVNQVPVTAGVNASTTVGISLAVGVPALGNSSSGASYGYIPDLLIPAGWGWQSSVFGMDVADQLSSIVLLVQRFPNDAAVISAEQ